MYYISSKTEGETRTLDFTTAAFVSVFVKYVIAIHAVQLRLRRTLTLLWVGLG